MPDARCRKRRSRCGFGGSGSENGQRIRQHRDLRLCYERFPDRRPGQELPVNGQSAFFDKRDAEPRDGLLSIAERPSIVRRPRALPGIKQRRCRNQQDSGHLLNRAQRKLGRTSAKDVVKMME